MKVLHGKRPIETILSLVCTSFFFIVSIYPWHQSVVIPGSMKRASPLSGNGNPSTWSWHLFQCLKDFGCRLQVPNIETISIATDCYGFGNAISKVPKTARHSIIQQKMCGRNQEIKLAIKIWVGSWDEEFKWTLMVLGKVIEGEQYLYSHISQCSHSNQSTGQYKCFPGELSNCFYTSLPPRSSNE